MYAVVDTNVLVVANNKAQQASAQCVVNCIKRLQTIQTSEVLVLDDCWRILNEYKKQADESGQPGVGDTFLKLVLKRAINCQYVTITPDDGTFKEFPKDPELEGFDPSDRKFVAVALTHPECPPIYNAVDSDWQLFQDALKAAGVQVEFLCPDQFTS